MRRFWATLAVIGLGVAPAVAQNATPDAGREVAQRWCVNCHIIGPKQPQGTDVTPSFRSIAQRPTTTAASLRAFLITPHGRMPDQALSNADLNAVVAYILSLKR